MNLLFIDVPWWLLLLGLIIAYYFYTSRNYGYWESVGVPGVKPSPFIGTFPLSIIRGTERMVDLQLKAEKMYGKIRGGYIGDGMILETSDLEVLKEIFVKKFADFRNKKALGQENKPMRSGLLAAKDQHWKNVRSTLAPAFSSGKLKQMIGRITKCCDTLNQHLAKSEGKEINVKDYMGAFTMDVIASVAFGIDVDSQSDRNNVFLQHAKTTIDFDMTKNYVLIAFLMFPSLASILNKFGLLNIFPSSSVNFFGSVVDKAMEERSSGAKSKKLDFIQLMINAGKTHDSTEQQEVDAEISSDFTDIRPSKIGLNHEEIVANGMLFMVAGYDTTASCLSYTTNCLAVNPDVQDKVREEVDTLTGELGWDDPDVYNKMTYLDKVISESLRLFPPVTGTERVASRDTVIKGIPIKEGTMIFMPSISIHRSEEHWPNPNKFDPERFSPEEKAKRDPFAYSPFGQGPRNCIGMRLALTEVKIALAKIISEYEIVRGEHTQNTDDIKFKNTSLLSPEQPITVRYVKRTDKE